MIRYLNMKNEAQHAHTLWIETRDFFIFLARRRFVKNFEMRSLYEVSACVVDTIMSASAATATDRRHLRCKTMTQPLLGFCFYFRYLS